MPGGEHGSLRQQRRCPVPDASHRQAGLKAPAIAPQANGGGPGHGSSIRSNKATSRPYNATLATVPPPQAKTPPSWSWPNRRQRLTPCSRPWTFSRRELTRRLGSLFAEVHRSDGCGERSFPVNFPCHGFLWVSERFLFGSYRPRKLRALPAGLLCRAASVPGRWRGRASMPGRLNIKSILKSS